MSRPIHPKLLIAIANHLYLYPDDWGRCGRLRLYIPLDDDNRKHDFQMLIKLFKELNDQIWPIFSFADEKKVANQKKKHSGLPVNFQAELPGVFWLTHFNNKYINFFGQDKFEQLENIAEKTENGVVLKLGETPNEDDLVISRAHVTEILGPMSFVGPKRILDNKNEEHVLTFEQLKA